MATICPVCNTGTLKKGEKMVYCSDYKPKKVGDNWINEGSCGFKIHYANKAFGNIDAKQIKLMIEGKTIHNKKGDSMVLDLESEYFTKIEFAPKVEDEDL